MDGRPWRDWRVVTKSSILNCWCNVSASLRLLWGKCVFVYVFVCVWERKCEPQVSLFYVQPQQVLKKIELVAAGSKHREANLAAGSIS